MADNRLPVTGDGSPGGVSTAPELMPSPASETTESTRSGVAAAALLLGAAANEISAEAETTASSPPTVVPAPPGLPRSGRRASIARSPRRRRPARLGRGSAASAPAMRVAAQEGDAPPSTKSELRDWVKDNATLLSNASLLISIAALALSLLPTTGVLDPYIKALILGAALLLLAELHHQWPDDLQLHMLRPASLPENHSWRMTGFAFLMQVATLVFAVWATLTSPIILIPLTALAVVLAFRHWYFRRFRGVLSKIFGVIALIAVVALSELLMVVVWAAITNDVVTIELWMDERPGLTLDDGR